MISGRVSDQWACLPEVLGAQQMLLPDAGPPARLSVASEDLRSGVDWPRGHDAHCSVILETNYQISPIKSIDHSYVNDHWTTYHYLISSFCLSVSFHTLKKCRVFGRQLEFINDDMRYKPLHATLRLPVLSNALESNIAQIVWTSSSEN